MNSPSATHFLVIDVGTTSLRAAIVDGADRQAARERWADALERARTWHPDLSALDF